MSPRVGSTPEPDAEEPARWSSLQALLAADPTGRGLAGLAPDEAPGARLSVAEAASELASRARHVAIVTGFPILQPGGGAVAETDGPPGALYLAAVLTGLGVKVTLLADRLVRAALECGCREDGLPPAIVTAYAESFPAPNAGSPGETSGLGHEPTASLPNSGREAGAPASSAAAWTHLIAIERPGPAHNARSLTAQSRVGTPPLDLFKRDVPAADRDRCHNMRGTVIDEFCDPVYQVFEQTRNVPHPPVTIGAIDGGNEIGAGSIPWEVIRARLPETGARIACRVPTDYTLTAGISNWAAYALALGAAYLSGNLDAARPYTAARHSRLIEALVQQAGLVDGVSGLHVPSVDGVPLAQYLRTLADMRLLFGLPE